MTVNEAGWPYVLHQGGLIGFLKVSSPKELAFAEFRGNTQLISVGNVRTGAATDRAMVEQPAYKAKVERVAFIQVVAFDWNCPQLIIPRYTENEFAVFQS